MNDMTFINKLLKAYSKRDKKLRGGMKMSKDFISGQIDDYINQVHRIAPSLIVRLKPVERANYAEQLEFKLKALSHDTKNVDASQRALYRLIADDINEYRAELTNYVRNEDDIASHERFLETEVQRAIVEARNIYEKGQKKVVEDESGNISVRETPALKKRIEDMITKYNWDVNDPKDAYLRATSALKLRLPDQLRKSYKYIADFPHLYMGNNDADTVNSLIENKLKRGEYPEVTETGEWVTRKEPVTQKELDKLYANTLVRQPKEIKPPASEEPVFSIEQPKIYPVGYTPPVPPAPAKKPKLPSGPSAKSVESIPAETPKISQAEELFNDALDNLPSYINEDDLINKLFNKYNIKKPGGGAGEPLKEKFLSLIRKAPFAYNDIIVKIIDAIDELRPIEEDPRDKIQRELEQLHANVLNEADRQLADLKEPAKPLPVLPATPINEPQAIDEDVPSEGVEEPAAEEPVAVPVIETVYETPKKGKKKKTPVKPDVEPVVEVMAESKDDLVNNYLVLSPQRQARESTKELDDARLIEGLADSREALQDTLQEQVKLKQPSVKIKLVERQISALDKAITKAKAQFKATHGKIYNFKNYENKIENPLLSKFDATATKEYETAMYEYAMAVRDEEALPSESNKANVIKASDKVFELLNRDEDSFNKYKLFIPQQIDAFAKDAIDRTNFEALGKLSKSEIANSILKKLIDQQNDISKLIRNLPPTISNEDIKDIISVGILPSSGTAAALTETLNRFFTPKEISDDAILNGVKTQIDKLSNFVKMSKAFIERAPTADKRDSALVNNLMTLKGTLPPPPPVAKEPIQAKTPLFAIETIKKELGQTMNSDSIVKEINRRFLEEDPTGENVKLIDKISSDMLKEIINRTVPLSMKEQVLESFGFSEEPALEAPKEGEGKLHDLSLFKDITLTIKKPKKTATKRKGGAGYEAALRSLRIQ